MPIVFYYGVENWTAAVRLHERVLFSDGIVAQITGVLLSKNNVPEKEIDKFSEQIKERHMGRLFENFEAYDVQETRRIAREEGIENLVKVNKKHGISKEETSSDLMDLYHLSVEKALKAVELYW